MDLKFKSICVIIITLLLRCPVVYCKEVSKRSNPRKNFHTQITKKEKSVFDAPPVITATGNGVYCPGSKTNIVSTVSITDADPSDIGTETIYIQISSGYEFGSDRLELNNPALHPNIIANWNAIEGKLILTSSIPGVIVTYIDFEKAIKDVQFSNSSLNPSGTRDFSISLVEANYLPSNGHYYFFIPRLGIKWTEAKIAAENQIFYGLRGYLATLTFNDEAQLAGQQSQGTGWIGANDSEVEGVWKWVTGPEGLANSGTGIVFWNGAVNGSTTLPFNFAFWNSNEPNNLGGFEHYAHITAPGVGIPGSWNDLGDSGGTDPSDPYHPRGYVVEFGGMPGDPVLQLSASTRLIIPSITSTTPAEKCGSGKLTLTAVANVGTINWYDQKVGGNVVGTGSSFETPVLNITTSYYAELTGTTCTLERVEVLATINEIPSIVTTNSPVRNCGFSVVRLSATPSAGTVNWYADATSVTPIATGTDYITNFLNSNTTFYAEAINNSCTNNTRVPVEVVFYTPPFVLDEEKIICPSQPLTLDAALENVTYLWSTGETSKKIDVTEPGLYSVYVTSPDPANCTSIKNFAVVRQITPKIKAVLVNETTVTIDIETNANYFEFSIDGENFQTSNEFKNVPAGIQTAFVRHITGCESDQKRFIVINPPRFFTPNGDGYNDKWEIKGLERYATATVKIFDRYGKLIVSLDANKNYWDGTFINNPMPADDYWYILNIEPLSIEKHGHFSLKR